MLGSVLTMVINTATKSLPINYWSALESIEIKGALIQNGLCLIYKFMPSFNFRMVAFSVWFFKYEKCYFFNECVAVENDVIWSITYFIGCAIVKNKYIDFVF